MNLLRRLVAGGGWLAYTGNQLQIGAYTRSRDRAIRPSWIFLWAGLLALFTIGAVGAAIDSAASSLTNATVADVASGAPLLTGSRYVSVSGKLSQPVTALCSRTGSCWATVFVLQDLSIDESVFAVLPVGFVPDANPDGSVTIRGRITDGISDPRLSDWKSQVGTAGPLVAPSSSVYLDSTWHPLGLTISIVGVVVFGGFEVLMALGWMAGFIPYTAISGGLEAPARGEVPVSPSVSVRITGILVDTSGIKRSYRNRPARLGASTGSLDLAIQQWLAVYRHSARSKTPYTTACLLAADIMTSSRGSIHLVRSTKPAIRITSRECRLVLAFDDPAVRDQFFALCVR